MGMFGTAQGATNKGKETGREGGRFPPTTGVVCVFVNDQLAHGFC